MTDRDEFVSASDLARMGYCERQVAFDASHGQRVTVEHERARDRGLKAHAAFYDESRRIAAASATKGRCFIATLALGECDDTRVLRAFRDLYCPRRFNIDPPCRLNFDPGLGAGIAAAGCA